MTTVNNLKTSLKDSQKVLPWLLPLGVMLLYLAIDFVSPDHTMSALKASGNILKQTMPPLILAFVMLFGLNLFITPAHVSRFLGRQAGAKGILLSSAAGILSMGPIYAWFPLLKSLREKGATDFHLANFLGSRAVKPVLVPLMVSYFGWRFSIIFLLINWIGALMVATVVSFSGKHRNKRL